MATSTKAGTNYGYDTPGAGTSETDQTKSIYGRRRIGRDEEPLDKYMQRVWQQATRAGSPTLNPYAEENPFANSPYAKWFQNRYAQTIPANITLERVLTADGAGQDFEPYMQGKLGDAVSHGAGRGFGTGLQGSSKNLSQLNTIVEQLGRGDKSGLSADQIAIGNTVKDDPRIAMQLVNAQLQGSINPFGNEYLANMMEDAAANYYDDPVGHDPAQKGAFLTNILPKLNLT
jgi:hypothetical protein